MRFGVVILPDDRWSVAAPRWSRAEALGFDHAWTYDHLAWRSLRDGPWMGALPTLTAAAVTTSRIRLGPLVASPNYRHPVPFAKELMTLDDLSGGRLVVGLGAGGEGWDATVLGRAPWTGPERADRFTEFVELTDLLLRQPATTFTGRFYSADGARNVPGCVQQPRAPFAIAATGPRGLHLAARVADTWVAVGDRRRPERGSVADGVGIVREQSRRLEDACAEVGRDPSTVARLLLTGPLLDPAMDSAEQLRDAVGQYAAIGITDYVVHWPRPEEPYAGDRDVFESVFDAVLEAGGPQR